MFTYNQFIENTYTANPIYARYNISRAKFRKEYPLKYGFSAWLESLRGCDLTLTICRSIATTYPRHGKRTPAEIPAVLSSISHQYGVELPAVYGLLTAEYWDKGDQ